MQKANFHEKMKLLTFWKGCQILNNISWFFLIILYLFRQSSGQVIIQVMNDFVAYINWTLRQQYRNFLDNKKMWLF